MTGITKLRVGDEDFLVASMIERCPKSMMLRELVKNALEAACLAERGQRTVEITAVMVDGVRKLRFWNTGPGLDADELFSMCDIASSVGKVQALDRNFGMGAKVATLPSNHLGVRYRSCKGGIVSEVTIGKRGGVYGRVLRNDGPGGSMVAVLDVTRQVREAGGDTSRDWTEVTLLGQRADQDTVADPYDGNPRMPKGWVLRELQHRFFRIGGGVRVMLGPDVSNAVRMRAFLPLASHMEERYARWEAIELADGIVARFGYDPAHPSLPGRNASFVDRLSPDFSFAGLVHDDEFYDFRTGMRWTQEAPGYGISFGARHLSVVIELPPGYPVRPEGYRQFLRYRNGAQDQVRLNDFAAMVRAHRPGWVRDLVQSLSPDLDLLGDVNEQLQKLIAELGITRKRFKVRRPPPVKDPVRGIEDGVAGAARAADPAATTPPPKQEVDGAAVDEFEDLEAIPEFLLLRSEDEIADRNLTYRAARFYPETHQVYVNLCYPSVARMADALAATAPGAVPVDRAEAIALNVAEHILVLRLGQALVYGLSKREAEKGWSAAEKLQATGSEMLTMIAETLPNAMLEARQMFDERLADAMAAASGRGMAGA
ncbi:ATP-binding protein [Roseomonas sp. CAU 1739]|uniref:ATP-binding protein n=1 Tax=Roseomonas sp. CAU 1739 TaxID=3140364 RepID=UPI00325AA6DE